MTEVTLTEKTCKYTGKQVWFVEYKDAKGRSMRTSPTTFREEACTWGRIIRQHGYCMSAKAGPV